MSGFVHIYKPDFFVHSFIITIITIIIIIMCASCYVGANSVTFVGYNIRFFFTDAKFRTATIFVTVDLQKRLSTPFVTVFIFCLSLPNQWSF